MTQEKLKAIITNADGKLNELKVIDYSSLQEKTIELESLFNEFRGVARNCSMITKYSKSVS